MNITGLSMQLHNTSGNISEIGANTQVLALVIKSQLVGSLTINGIVNSDGSAYGAWTLAPGTAAGYYAAPGSGATGGGPLNYSLSSTTDADAAVIAYRRLP